jgi:hypothetical protein
MSITTDIPITNIFTASGSGNQFSIDITGCTTGWIVMVYTVKGTARAVTDGGSNGFAVPGDGSATWDGFRSAATPNIAHGLFWKNTAGTETTITFDNTANGSDWYITAYDVPSTVGLNTSLATNGVLSSSGISNSSGTRDWWDGNQPSVGTPGLYISRVGINTTGATFAGTVDWLSSDTADRSTSTFYQAQSALEMWEGYKRVGGEETPDLNGFFAPDLDLSASVSVNTYLFGFAVSWDYATPVQTDAATDASDGAGGLNFTSGVFTKATIGAVYYYLQVSATAPNTSVMQSGSGALYHGDEIISDATSATHNVPGNTAGLNGGSAYNAFIMQRAYELNSAVRRRAFTWPGRTVTCTVEALSCTENAATIDRIPTWRVTDVDLDETITDGQTGVIITITGTVAATGKKVFITQGANSVEQTVTAETASSVTITVSYGGILSGGAATLYVRNPL